MIESTLVRVEYPDHPRRCQSGGKLGQCSYLAPEGSQYCQKHGANTQQNGLKAKFRRQYNFAQWQATVEGFSDYEHIKSLRDEVGIMRMLLQNIAQLCKNETDLLLYTGKISDVVSEIKSLVVAMHRLDTSLGTMLDKTAALNLATILVEIVAEEVSDIQVCENIGRRFSEAVLQSGDSNA